MNTNDQFFYITKLISIYATEKSSCTKFPLKSREQLANSQYSAEFLFGFCLFLLVLSDPAPNFLPDTKFELTKCCNQSLRGDRVFSFDIQNRRRDGLSKNDGKFQH